MGLTKDVQIQMQEASYFPAHICYKMVYVSIKDYILPLNWHQT